MKATEIMMGDWVYNTHNRQPEQVCEIREHMVMLTYSDLHNYDEIEPIPLAAEFFDRNGWHREEGDGYCQWYFLSDDYCEITAHEFNDGMWRLEYDCIEMGGIPSESENVCWLHELQHFLGRHLVDFEIKMED